MRHYVALMPRLAAEERLAGITDAAIAAATMPQQDARDVQEELGRAARDGRRTARAGRASPAMLAAMGICVVSEAAPVSLSEASEEGLTDG